MVRTSTRTIIAFIIGLTTLAILTSCKNPTSHPIVQPPRFRDGVPLEIVNNTISPSATGLPYRIHQDWIIDPNQTITIMPGTEIMFDSLTWVDVQGKIIAHGTIEQPITFTTAYLKPDLGQWRGFKLRNPNDGSEFEHCIFTYGAYFDIDTVSARGQDAQHYKGMLAIVNSSPTIERCVIFKNQDNGIFISGPDARPRVRYNILTTNDASGIRADTAAQLDNIDISYNCVSDNSAPAFLMGFDSTRWGHKAILNANLDSCDIFHNVDIPPAMTDPVDGNYALTSCSPCVDAGPGDDATQNDPDGTRADMGTIPYVQVPGELRGVISGTLNSATHYRMSCDLRVRPGESLTIPAGTIIDVTGLYGIQVFGTLLVQGTPSGRVQIAPSSPDAGALWDGIQFFNHDSVNADPPSSVAGLDIIKYNTVEVHRPGIRFSDVNFTGGFQYGVLVKSGTLSLTDSVSFQGCAFSRCGEFGIRVDSCAAMIRNTMIEECAGRGITMAYVGDAMQISNSVVRACSTIAVVVDSFSSPLILNNTFAYCGYFGMTINANSNPVVMNNIVALNKRYGVDVTLSSFPTLSYNDVFGNNTITGQVINYVPDNQARSNSIELDPLFVGLTDLHINSGSPCIDAGNPGDQYRDSNGSPNDIGAYGGPNGGTVGTPPALRRSYTQLVSK